MNRNCGCIMTSQSPSQVTNIIHCGSTSYSVHSLSSLLRTFHIQAKTSSKPTHCNGLSYWVDELTSDSARLQIHQQNKLFSCFQCLILAWITMQPYITGTVCHKIFSDRSSIKYDCSLIQYQFRNLREEVGLKRGSALQQTQFEISALHQVQISTLVSLKLKNDVNEN